MQTMSQLSQRLDGSPSGVTELTPEGNLYFKFGPFLVSLLIDSSYGDHGVFVEFIDDDDNHYDLVGADLAFAGKPDVDVTVYDFVQADDLVVSHLTMEREDA